MDRQLKKIATASRREMESFARKYDEVGGGPSDLECYCAIASFFFAMVGRKCGYKLTLVEGVAFDSQVMKLQNGEQSDDDADSNHCWVEYDGKIIDLTATQFDSKVKKVHIVDDENGDYWPLKKDNEAKNSLKTWSSEQSPYSYMKDLRDRATKVSERLAA